MSVKMLKNVFISVISEGLLSSFSKGVASFLYIEYLTIKVVKQPDPIDSVLDLFKDSDCAEKIRRASTRVTLIRGENLDKKNFSPGINLRNRKYKTRIFCRSLIIFYGILLNEKTLERTCALLEEYELIGITLPWNEKAVEISDCFKKIRIFLGFSSIFDFYSTSLFEDLSPQYIALLSRSRTSIINVICKLQQTILDIKISESSHSRGNQLAALARTDASLQTLYHYVTTQIPSGYPEQKLFHRIIDQWRDIITTAAGTLGQTQLLEPVHNPYVVGTPVTGNLFVGREDILNRIKELWRPSGQLPSILLYGHRRMGKTSILQNLQGHLGPHTTLIDFNMQRVGMVNNPGELLHNLALALYDSLPEPTDFPEPTEPTFTQQNPYAAFDRFLKQLNPHRNQTRYIIALDEFELLEQRINEGRLDPELLTYLRALINTYPWFILALAGLHSLQEMTHDYWSPLFGNVTSIPVSFLSPKAATNLITNPTDDFPIDYDPDAIAEIYSLTGGQPYLLQLICHNLVSRYNHQRFEDNIDIDPRFSLTDVQTIINSPTFFSQGHAYFSGIWSQASEQHGPTQHAILRALSQPQTSDVELLRDVQRLDHYAEALELLQRHDIIHRVDDRYQFVVPLMQRWVAQHANLGETGPG